MEKNVAVEFQNMLLEWYGNGARELPWRKDPTPYKVWISEMMLQQTRVDTVIPYFTRFINQVPTLLDLAEIEEDRLLKLWQGLGYYNRALNLKRAAQRMVAEFHGEIPSDRKELLSLPGIGEYSAGAISSIAFGKRTPAIDGNVLRIVARITASREDIGGLKAKKVFEPIVKDLLPLVGAGDFNQALMDLGATVCLSKGLPKCKECPVSLHCLAYKQGLILEIPVKTNKKNRTLENKTVMVISKEGRFAIRKREATGLLPSLWEFPNFSGHLTKRECEKALDGLGLKKIRIRPIAESQHVFTHLKWQMKGYFITVEGENKENELVWATMEEMNSVYSIPTAFGVYIKVCSE